MKLFSFAKMILTSLFRKPATVLYPFCPAKISKDARGLIAIDISKCIYCGICVRKCPTGALAVDRGSKSWQIDRLKCIWCGACVEVCPKKCLVQNSEYSKPTCAKNIEVFKNA
jgi:formate hydrogenlyase subunit 6/NADH:ubiquinone oxidoreductase subunit I